jgi:hypothetical protein
VPDLAPVFVNWVQKTFQKKSIVLRNKIAGSVFTLAVMTFILGIIMLAKFFFEKQKHHLHNYCNKTAKRKSKFLFFFSALQ